VIPLEFKLAGWLVLVAGIGIGFLMFVKSERNIGAQACQLAQAQAVVKAQAAAASQAAADREKFDEQERISNAQLGSVIADRDNLLARLRNRPARPASMPAPSSEASSGGSGAVLYREDAEFLTGEAARADQLRVELGRCQAE
jgi:hypothetical protein